MRLLGFQIVRVVGSSMQPLLASGDYALFGPTWRLKVGQTVLVDHPKFGRIIKSIAYLKDESIRLSGLNSLSTSTEDLGSVNKTHVIGKLITRVKRHQ